MKSHKKTMALLIILAFVATVCVSFTTLPSRTAFLPASAGGVSPDSVDSKIDPFLLTMIGSGSLPNAHPTGLIIVFNAEDSNAGLRVLLSEFKDIVVKRVYTYIPAVAVEAPLSTVPQIASLPQVSKVWYDYPVHLTPKNISQTGISTSGVSSKEAAHDSKVEDLWSKNLNGSGIVIALLDSGIDASHPDLDDLDDNNNTFDPKIIANVSMVDYDPFPFDFNGHGTYVAGIIAGTGNASSGTYKGIAPQARLLNVKVFDIEGLSFYSWIMSGVEWSVSHGADIIVVPFAGPGYPDDPLCTAVDRAVMMGVTVIAAAGDDGPAYTSVGSPGMALTPITVGSYNTSSGQVCYNSSRGPSLFMWTKPDLVAPGYNITSCNASKPDLGVNISFPSMPEGGYGTPLDGNYTSATGTAAAAGYVAGVAALLLQAFPFLTPEALRVAMMRTAIDLGEDPNTQGAGLLDANATYNYLKSLGSSSAGLTRMITPSLPYTGFFFTNDTSSNLTTYCIVGTYGTFVAMQVQNTTSNFNSTHLLQGRFAVRYNDSDNVTLFMLTTVYREMHSTHTGIIPNMTVPGLEQYQRAVAVLGNDNILIVMTVDCWNNTNQTGAFRIMITLINIGSTPLTGVSLSTCWDPDLFTSENESTYMSDDHAWYNTTDDLIYANDTHDTSTTEHIYVGFMGNVSSAAREVGENSTVFEHFLGDTLKGTSSYTGNVGLAMKWNLTDQLNPGEKTSFVGVLGVGGNYSQMLDSTQSLLDVEFPNVTDLCVVNASLSRKGETYTPFASEAFVLNTGNVVTNATVFFFANKSSDGSSIVYAEIFQYKDFQPLTFKKISASWEPTNSGVYAAGWLITELPNLLSVEQLLSGNITLNISETYLLDNFIARNVFIGTPPSCTILFPTSVPNRPFDLNFPLDFSYTNLTLVSTHPLENVQVAYSGNATQLFNETPRIVTRECYATILISFNTTYFPRPGHYMGVIAVTAGGKTLGSVTINFNLSYPEGRLFFDGIHNKIGLESWGERLDSIYSGYFQFAQELFNQGTDIDDIPFLTEYNRTILSFYDGIVIVDPEKGFTTQEITTLQGLLENGTGVLICVEPENECNWTAVNLITQPYGITVNSSDTGTATVTAADMNHSHRVTRNLNSIELDSFAILDVNTTKGAVILANASDGKIVMAAARAGYGRLLVIGDSSIFDSGHINLSDNAQLAVNAVNWLLENRLVLNIKLFLPNPDGTIHIGENLYVAIHVTDTQGNDILCNITLLAIFILPNGTFLPLPAFQTNQLSWYVALFFTYFTNQTGDYTMILYADAENYTTTHYVYSFKVEPEKPTIPPLFYFPQQSREYAIFGFTFMGAITLIVTAAYLLERRRIRKRVLVPEPSRELRNTVRNTVNEVRAVFKEVDMELSRKDIDDFDRIRIISEKLGRLRKALDKAKRTAERIGE
ncbi:MAG: S8 family serine peptidase [Candidatus Freyarchaeota archaeon]